MLRSASPTAPIVTAGDLGANATSFARHLRAANLSPATQRTYLASVERMATFLEGAGMPTDVANIRRDHLEACMEDQLANWKPTTAANRYSGIRPFFVWLVEEGEIRDNPMIRMRKPKLPEYAPAILSDEQLVGLLAACKPRHKEDFAGYRDTALLRTFMSTGARLSEIANLRWTPKEPATNDVDLDQGIIRILQGKNRRERIRYLNSDAVKALDTYAMRKRSGHPKAQQPWLWLGEKGHMTDSGIAQEDRSESSTLPFEDSEPDQRRRFLDAIDEAHAAARVLGLDPAAIGMQHAPWGLRADAWIRRIDRMLGS